MWSWRAEDASLGRSTRDEAKELPSRLPQAVWLGLRTLDVASSGLKDDPSWQPALRSAFWREKSTRKNRLVLFLASAALARSSSGAAHVHRQRREQDASVRPLCPAEKQSQPYLSRFSASTPISHCLSRLSPSRSHPPRTRTKPNKSADINCDWTVQTNFGGVRFGFADGTDDEGEARASERRTDNTVVEGGG